MIFHNSNDSMQNTTDKYWEVMVVMKSFVLMVNIVFAGAASAASIQERHDAMFILNAEAFKHYVEYFNTMEPENIVNYVSNEASWEWMKENIPFFECPDKSFEQIYYFRWWTFR